MKRRSMRPLWATVLIAVSSSSFLVRNKPGINGVTEHGGIRRAVIAELQKK